MILAALILVLLAGGALGWAAERARSGASRPIALLALATDAVLLVPLWLRPATPGQRWLVEWRQDWIPRFGASFHFALDGLNLTLVSLSILLGLVAVACSWTEIRERIGFFHFNLLWTLAGVLGVFLALDLFLFYFFWELMLIPMYALIVLWGHEQRLRAGYKFFLFTQAGGLLMLIAIVALYATHGATSGVYTFDLTQLSAAGLRPSVRMLLLLGFLVAFAVKLPALPLHTWLPEAHTEAPTAGSVILAGLLLKTGAYGLLRIVLPLFPDSFAEASPWLGALGVAGILYGGLQAFGQRDIKRLVAYSSVSHMGFVLLGVSVATPLALTGAVVQMVCHGITTGALFMLVGQLQERTGTRDMDRMGGLSKQLPRLGGATLFFAIASLGLPGLGNFVGEFLVLLGSYSARPTLTAVAAGGLIVSALYSLALIRRVYQGPSSETADWPDLSPREAALAGILAVAILSLGLQPQPLLNALGPAVETLAAAF